MMKGSDEEGLWAGAVREAFLGEEAFGGAVGLRDLEGTGEPCREAFHIGKQPKQRPGGQGVVLGGAAKWLIRDL